MGVAGGAGSGRRRVAGAGRSLVGPLVRGHRTVLSAKAHASWAMCLGDGFRAVERVVDLARIVLQVEAVRACVARDAPLDRLRLTAAIRQSDLMLVHLGDPRTLVD